mmetsp:Transcript_10423/g.23605  ORF Transcript_10423/g.23605 Transcript_10423/m.23605 type:complete len:1381 (-) Transcript_10423:154-4296(-)
MRADEDLAVGTLAHPPHHHTTVADFAAGVGCGFIATGGDAAGGGALCPANSRKAVAAAKESTMEGHGMDGASAAGQVQRDALLDRALREVERLTARAAQAEEERRKALEETRSFQGSIRIMGRVRPALEGEEDDCGCLRVISKSQLEVLTEPRALLTEGSQVKAGRQQRHHRASTGVIREGSMSPAASSVFDNLAEAASFEPRTFMFDQLFDVDAGNDDVFSAVHDEITAAVDGEAVCILAYGATGSGKTHTVVNLAERTARELERQAISLAQGGIRLEITLQIVEIYNEQLRDLLVDSNSSSGPHGHGEPAKLKVSVSSVSPSLIGAASRVISAENGCGIARSLEEMLKVGQAQRATSSTAVHGRSSRSHLVMSLFLALRDSSTGQLQRSGKLSLVDLAGSERLKQSEAVGEQLREAQHINRSLSALADVISAKERKVAYVPYRNSKLTHLLQDALGGQQQCRTVVIVALPPTRQSISETLHSLQFSSRLTALSLPTVASRRSLRGLDPSRRGGGELSRGNLRMEVEKLRSEFSNVCAQLDDCRTKLEEKDRQLEQAQKRNEELRASTEVFVRGRERLFDGFVALNRCLKEVEATTFECPDGDQRQPPDVASDVVSGPPSLQPSFMQDRIPVQSRAGVSAATSAALAAGDAEALQRQARASPPRTASRSNSGGVLIRRMQPVLHTSRSVGAPSETTLRSGGSSGSYQPGLGSRTERRRASPPASSARPRARQRIPAFSSRSTAAVPDTGRGSQEQLPMPDGRGSSSTPITRWNSSRAPRSAAGAGADARSIGHRSPGARQVAPAANGPHRRMQDGPMVYRTVHAGARSTEQMAPEYLIDTGSSRNSQETFPEGNFDNQSHIAVAQSHLYAATAASRARSVGQQGNLRGASPMAKKERELVLQSAGDANTSIRQRSPSGHSPGRSQACPSSLSPRAARVQEQDTQFFSIASPPRQLASPLKQCQGGETVTPGTKVTPTFSPRAEMTPASPAWSPPKWAAALETASSTANGGLASFGPPPRSNLFAGAAATGGLPGPVVGTPLTQAFRDALAAITSGSSSAPTPPQQQQERSWPPGGTPDEAGGTALATPQPKARSVSATRRTGTPREYVVEVLSPARALELSRDLPSSGVDLQATAEVVPSPRSPALLLCPGEEEQRLNESDAEENGGGSTISDSSDEGEIRDRLKQSLQLLGNSSQSASAEAAATARTAGAPRTVQTGRVAGGAPNAPRNRRVPEKPGANARAGRTVGERSSSPQTRKGETFRAAIPPVTSAGAVLAGYQGSSGSRSGPLQSPRAARPAAPAPSHSPSPAPTHMHQVTSPLPAGDWRHTAQQAMTAPQQQEATPGQSYRSPGGPSTRYAPVLSRRGTGGGPTGPRRVGQ